MYIHTNFTDNPTKNKDPIPYYPILIRKKLGEGEDREYLDRLPDYQYEGWL